MSVPPWEAVLNQVLGWTGLQQQQPWISMMWDVHGRSHVQDGEKSSFPMNILQNYRGVGIRLPYVSLKIKSTSTNHCPVQGESKGVTRHLAIRDFVVITLS